MRSCIKPTITYKHIRNRLFRCAIILLFLTLVLLGLSGYRIYQTVQSNKAIINLWTFENRPFEPIDSEENGPNQYANHLPMEEMDFKALRYSPAFEPNDECVYPVDSFSLPIDLTYYQEVDGVKNPAFTLKKGTLIPIHIIDFTGYTPYGYGLISYPTYERGWRYAIPLSTADDLISFPKSHYDRILTQEKYDFLYVRLEDLEEIYLARVKILAGDSALKKENLFISQSMYYDLRQIDIRLYIHGIYSSPDLPLSAWSQKAILLLIGTSISLLTACALLICRKIIKKNKLGSENIQIGLGVFSVVFFCATIVLSITTGTSLSRTIQQNHCISLQPYQSVYDDAAYLSLLQEDVGRNQYMDKVSMEKIDFDKLGYGPMAVAFGGYTLPSEFFPLLDDITYYREVCGIKIPVKTLKKGTLIPFDIGATLHNPYGYGFYSYPTYERGWRYAVPFSTKEEPITISNREWKLSQEEYEYLYIRIEDLETVWMSSAEAVTPGTIDNIDCIDPVQLAKSREINLLLVDHQLYTYGVYFSPDLSPSILTRPLIILLTSATICLLLSLFLFQQAKHHKP